MNLEPKHIAPYVPYRLQAIMLDFKVDYVNKEVDTIVGIHQWDKTDKLWSLLTVGGSKPSLDRIMPKLRPMTDLIKEIEHNGIKFIPLVELAKIADLDTTKYQLSSNPTSFGISCDIENDDDDNKYEVLAYTIFDGFGLHYRPSMEFHFLQNQFELFQKLYEWHFDVFHLIENNLAETL